MKATMSAEKARKRIRGEEDESKKSSSKKKMDSSNKGMKSKTSCLCGR